MIKISLLSLALVIVSFTFFRVLKDRQGITIPQENKSVEAVLEQKPIFSFSAVGDFGANPTTAKVLEQAANKTDFTIALGDNSYGQASDEWGWCEFVKQKTGETYPFMLVAGNHDTEKDKGYGQGNFERFAACLPNRMSNMHGTYGEQYYFDFKGVLRVIAISPDIDVYKTAGDYNKGGKDYQWVSDVIDDAKSKNITWLVMVMHKNCITMGVKTCEIGEDILNLALEKKVNIVFQGHEHGYMRSKPLSLNDKCPGISANSPNPNCISKDISKGGTTLIINGTGGIDLRDINSNHPDKIFFESWHGSNVEPAFGPTKVSVYKDRLDIVFETIDGQHGDNFSIAK